jgi:hypothetical protein
MDSTNLRMEVTSTINPAQTFTLDATVAGDNLT